VNVTDVLVSKIKNDRLELKVGNHLFGDPTPGVVKYLDVEYNDNSRKRVKENGYLKILFGLLYIVYSLVYL
jgi:hypothetical protein